MGNRSTARRDRRGRLSLSAVAVGAVIAAFPATAWAHAEFQGNSSVPANSNQKLTLNVPEEKGPSVHNTKVVFVVPSGFSVSGCDPKPQWKCAVAPASEGRTTTFEITVPSSMEEIERLAIEATLDYTAGDKSHAARALGIGRKTLYRKLEQYNGQSE